ncbi:MAG: HEPN domain-containing protein [Actinomycetota bacterium]
MARWTRGEADVEALVQAGDLQKLTGEAANGERLLAKAIVTLETARSVIERDPDSAFVLAYDAARQALTGLLAHQGLRPTTKGGHYAVERAVRAQFGPGFRGFGALRRRRNELEYPERPGDDATVEEASEAVDSAQAIIASANGLLRELGLFS